MKHRATIDVSNLPNVAMDHHSPVWWGNMLLLAIETTMFALLVAMLFYVRVVDFVVWPPPMPNLPVLYNSAPDLLMPTICLLILLLSVLPMVWVDRACLKRNDTAIKMGLVICVLMGTGAMLIRIFYGFAALHFKWNDNAYASITWTILGLHLTHIFVATSELLIMTIWAFVKGLDAKHARDIRITASYWYWVAGIWLLLYLVIWGGTRWL
jgi:heme/copper-type cytochrome/quinol oxidase subunit 3